LNPQRTFNPQHQLEIPAVGGPRTLVRPGELTARDDLSLVADTRTSQIHKPRAAGITGVTQLLVASRG
jgi:hypothetical protein